MSEPADEGVHSGDLNSVIGGTPKGLEAMMRRVAREEIASLSGLVMRRLQEEHLSRDPDRNVAEDVLDERLSEIFGEALQQFSADAT